ncbi:phosphotransferase family protein [Ensifer adhaerens]|uniref:phosphotransferase family protein n=1 Tax=Ensifer adhaerens TaxID=106592 RepID=UPI001CC0A9AF|nr:aminoglycoside phosphotransferase family protein [Ensifer adhaerens]UAX97236.1 aminoglycoside phosphotransferase family protein [Ensifer adhaerens]
MKATKDQAGAPVASASMPGEAEAIRAGPPVKQIVRELGLRSKALSVPIGSGQSSIAYDVGGTVLRMPRHTGAERDLLQEAAVLSAVRPLLPVPVPDLDVRRVDGQLVSLHTRIAGTPLTNLSELSEGQQRVFAADVAAFLHALHSVPTDRVAAQSAEAPSSEWGRLLAQCETLAFPLLAHGTVTAIRESFSDFLAICDTLPRCLIHGDFGSGNILVDRGRLSGVIDFSGCGPGDPAYDFASLEAGFGGRFVELVLEHFSLGSAARDRMRFYRMTFPLLDILHGIENRDPEALDAGVRAFGAGLPNGMGSAPV